ncbi:Ras-related protein Rab-3C [Microtus ochrogaster]|uniref:Ras-related protein Rab-3C n=1 Tax=Microtus ochrogaster TaxID=79684 RepID=A0A8J6GAD8_MICOH|nr:Ras-related protein Rab-3C [Microtus ochrogaster]
MALACFLVCSHLKKYQASLTLSRKDLQGFEFFETSAKDNVNVKQTFERLVDIICDKMSESLETDPAITAAKQSTRLKETPPPPQPNCGC